MRFSFLRWLGLIFTTSLICTFMLHGYLYQHYQINKLIKRNIKISLTNSLSEKDEDVAQLTEITLQVKDVDPTTIYDPPTIETSTLAATTGNDLTDEDTFTTVADVVEYEEECRIYSGDLFGPLKVNSTFQPKLKEAEISAGEDVINGCYQPPGCKSQQKVAVVIPYKNRYEHLLSLLHHLHPILQRQKIMYCVFVAEQNDDGMFNKARVMNAAFLEITKKWNNHMDPHSRSFDCFIFHDVDMLAEDDRNNYTCSDLPKHLSPAINKFNYTTGYGTKYGGVTAIRTEHYKRVNGHSNRFWGWGGEDNDMENRIEANGLNITTVNETIGRFKMIEHVHPWWFDPTSGVGSWEVTAKDKKKPKKENKEDTSGISNCKYTLIEVEQKKLWTRLSFDIRYHMIERVSIKFIGHKEPELEVKSLRLEKLKQINETEVLPPDQCMNPVYYKFPYMTINRTTNMQNATYTMVYKSLDEAQRQCNLLMSLCKGIVEQIAGKFSLRATGYVQENTLIYKYGLAEQYDVKETHYSTAAYVKICPESQSYTHFLKEPIILKGDAMSGLSQRYQLSFDIRIWHKTDVYFYYRAEIMTTHKAVMEEKSRRKVSENTWWDSLSKAQNNVNKLINTSDDAATAAHTVEQDDFSRLIRVQTPISGFKRKPGCYQVQSWISDAYNDVSFLDWTWWFQMRASSKEIEQEFLEKHLQESIELGKQNRDMMNNHKVIYKSLLEERRQKLLEKGKGESNRKAKEESENNVVVPAKSKELNIK